MLGFRSKAIAPAMMISAVLLAPLARAQERGPLALASASYFFVGGKIDTAVEGSADGRADVRRVHDPAAAAPPLSDRDGARRQPDRHQLHRHARRPRRLGAIFRAPRLCRLCGRPGRARPRRATGRQVYGPVQPSRHRIASSSASSRRSATSYGRRRICTRNGRAPASRAIRCSISSTPRNFPRSSSFAKQQELNRDALVALLDKIGPAILLTHSQSGAFGWPIADARPKLVKAIVAVEPSGPPVHDVEFKGAPDWFKDGRATKLSGLGEVPLTYDPPLDGRRRA